MNCWDLLGIEPTGDQDQIRQAYERQLKFASGDEAQALERAYREATGGAEPQSTANAPDGVPSSTRQTMIPDNSAMKTLIPGR